MMEQLRKAVIDSKMFNWVVKVVIGKNTNTDALQQAIADNISQPLTESSKDARADRLHKIFLGILQQGKKKILVIMDDLWEEFDLKDIGLTSPLPKGFKLLFTSRFQKVCTRMGVQTDSIFKIDLLNDAEAKTMFFEIVGPCLSDDHDSILLRKIGEDIVEKCGGLPLAIKMIATDLRGNTREIWDDTLSQLQDHDPKDLDGIEQKIREMRL